jgi:O-antigen/teichoic acid export membrane protein
MIGTLVRKAFQSPTLRSAAALAAGGIGFGVANLLLARVLSTAEFGVVSLLLSFIQVGAAVGAPGLPVLINRYHLGPSRRLVSISLVASALATLATLFILSMLYDIAVVLASVTGIAIGLAAMGRVSAAFFQAGERFGFSLMLIQVHNWVLLLSVPVLLLLGRPHALTVIGVVLCGYALTAWIGWQMAWRGSAMPSASAQSVPTRRWLSEGLSAAGFTIATNVMLQLDRLLIGGTLSIDDLATYAVIAAVAGSTFRMLQTGAGYSLLPRLRRCADRTTAWRMLGGELALLAIMGVLAGVAVMLVMPWLLEHFLHGRYDVTEQMVLAVIAIGFIRIGEASASATVSALGTTRELGQLNVLSWLMVATSSVCAVWGSRYGLIGMIYGLGAGWTVGAIGASILAAKALGRLPRKGHSDEQPALNAAD